MTLTQIPLDQGASRKEAHGIAEGSIHTVCQGEGGANAGICVDTSCAILLPPASTSIRLTGIHTSQSIPSWPYMRRALYQLVPCCKSCKDRSYPCPKSGGKRWM